MVNLYQHFELTVEINVLQITDMMKIGFNWIIYKRPLIGQPFPESRRFSTKATKSAAHHISMTRSHITMEAASGQNMMLSSKIAKNCHTEKINGSD